MEKQVYTTTVKIKPHGDSRPSPLSNTLNENLGNPLGKISIEYDTEKAKTFLEYLDDRRSIRFELIPSTSLIGLAINKNKTLIDYIKNSDEIIISFTGKAKLLTRLTLDEKGRIEITSE